MTRRPVFERHPEPRPRLTARQWALIAAQYAVAIPALGLFAVLTMAEWLFSRAPDRWE